MLTAMTAVENIVNGVTTKDNIWAINTETEYHEEKAAEVAPLPPDAAFVGPDFYGTLEERGAEYTIGPACVHLPQHTRPNHRPRRLHPAAQQLLNLPPSLRKLDLQYVMPAHAFAIVLFHSARK